MSGSKVDELRAMRETQTVAAELSSLARKINDEHEAAERAINESLLHAKRCGELLIEAKAAVAHGEWMGWVEENFRASDRTARGYMRIAKKWDSLEPKRQGLANLGIEEALAFLSDPRSAPAPKSDEGSPRQRRERLDNEATWSPELTESVKGSQPVRDSASSNGAPTQPKKRPTPSREEQERTSRANAYSHIGKVVYFADVVRGEKNQEHYTTLLAERPEEFYADQRYTVDQVIQASEEVIEWLPQFVATLKEKTAHA